MESWADTLARFLDALSIDRAVIAVREVVVVDPHVVAEHLHVDQVVGGPGEPQVADDDVVHRVRRRGGDVVVDRQADGQPAAQLGTGSGAMRNTLIARNYGPLPEPLEDLALKGIPKEPLAAFLEDQGFKTMLARLSGGGGASTGGSLSVRSRKKR